MTSQSETSYSTFRMLHEKRKKKIISVVRTNPKVRFHSLTSSSRVWPVNTLFPAIVSGL